MRYWLYNWWYVRYIVHWNTYSKEHALLRYMVPLIRLLVDSGDYRIDCAIRMDTYFIESL
jgi:hypothetical protein